MLSLMLMPGSPRCCDSATRASSPPLSRANQLGAAAERRIKRFEATSGRFFESDPCCRSQHLTIDRAMLNEQNELGLILDRTVEMDRVPDLMRSILTQMAREFPGQGLNRANLYALQSTT